MRVLLNALQAGNRSGTGRHTAELCRALPSADADLELVLAWPAGAGAPSAHPRVTAVPFPEGGGSRFLSEARGFPDLVRRFGPQALHYPSSTGPLTRTRPLALTVHDLCFLRHPEWFPAAKALYYRVFIARAAARADLILADSQATADDVRDLLRVPEDRIRVVPLGCDARFRPPDPEDTARLKTRLGLPDRYFLFVGTLEPRKNVARLVEAWDHIAGEPDMPGLVVAGRGGWKTGPIEAALRGVRCPERLKRLDHVPDADLPVLLGGAAAFVWPSLMEGFGLPVLEAMACGAPVVTSTTSSLPEVTGDAALGVDPLDTQALSDAMRRLAGDESLRKRLSEEGVKRAAGFTWQRTAALTAKACRELV